MKKLLWASLLVLLIPLWFSLYMVGVLGALAFLLWENLYHPIYERAGSPLDKK